MPTHYQTLKVAADAPPEVIKAAYRALSQQHHPDSNQECGPDAVRAMQSINEAYEILMDEEKRKAYDEQLPLEPAAGAIVKQEHQDSSAVIPKPHRRRRRRSRRSSGDMEDSLVDAFSGAYFRSSSERSGAIIPARSVLSPMFTSRPSTSIQGRMLPQTEAGPTAAAKAPSNASRGCRLISLVLAGGAFCVLLLGGLVAWKLGYMNRAWSWFQRKQAMEASEGLVFGGRNDVVPFMDSSTAVYNRPVRTPHGHPWPQTTGYLEGARFSHSGGGCTIIVDNTAHDADVHVKLLTQPSDKAGPLVSVREAFVNKRTQMRFEDLQPGTYELRYRSFGNGLVYRADVVEFSPDSLQKPPSEVVSLYKVMSGNSQRPVIPEGQF